MVITSFNNLGPRTVQAGGFKLKRGSNSFTGFSTATVVGFEADTYLAGSAIKFPLGRAPVAGAAYHMRFDMVKTAACTSTPIAIVRFGTAGTVADTARLTFTFSAGTAAVDSGVFELWLHWRTVGTAGVAVGIMTLNHALAATGLTSGGTGGQEQKSVVSGAFDSTVANSFIGVSFNGGTTGANFVGTCSLVEAEMRNPLV